MQVPYEYRRSQTLASKFARSALTQRQIKKYVILSASEISHDQSEKYMPRTFSAEYFADLTE